MTTAEARQDTDPDAPDADTGQEQTGQDGTGQDGDGRRTGTPFLVAALALLTVCAAAAVWFGAAWISASSDDALDVARARDEAVRAGEQAVLIFHTMDYRDVDAGLNRWVDASTGDMRVQLDGGRDSGRAVIEQSKRVSTATAYSTALIDLNETAGTATVISAVHQVVAQEGQTDADKYLRVQAALQRDADGAWKLAGLTYIAATPAA